MKDHFEYIRTGNAAKLIPYPLRAMRLSISLKLNIFDPWLVPDFYKMNLTEQELANGETLWWARWLYFQISYSRWV